MSDTIYDKEGPSELVIPEQRFLSCGMCKYHANTLVKSGMNPVRKDNCNHPDSESSGGFYYGNLQRNPFGVIETPSWCPFLKQKDNETVSRSPERDTE